MSYQISARERLDRSNSDLCLNVKNATYKGYSWIQFCFDFETFAQKIKLSEIFLTCSTSIDSRSIDLSNRHRILDTQPPHVAYFSMTMGPEEVQYCLDILDIVYPSAFFALFTKCHGTLPRGTSELSRWHTYNTTYHDHIQGAFLLRDCHCSKGGVQLGTKRVSLCSQSSQTRPYIYQCSPEKLSTCWSMLPEIPLATGVIRSAPAVEDLTTSTLFKEGSIFTRSH